MDVDDKKMIKFQEELVEILTKLESTYNLLKEGKEIPTGQKLLGVKQKLYAFFQEIKTLNENNQNK